MPQIKEHRDRLADYKSARYITGALRDISAIELRTYRERFERNTTLYDELTELYHLVSRIARKEGKRELRRKGDALHVAYTSNKHFYGSLNHDVMRELLAKTANTDRVLIIGETGKSYWLGSPKRRKEVSFMSFSDDMPSKEEAMRFFSQTAPYAQVFVYYPGWVNVFTQQVEVLDMTYSEQELPEASSEDIPQYILEPEIMQMFSFFETQVRYVLFERMLLETQLSRVSARLVRMDMADENAGKLIKNERSELRRAYASFSSIRLLETFTGYLQWHKKKTHSVR